MENISGMPFKSATSQQSRMDSNDPTLRWIDTPCLDYSQAPDKSAKTICNALRDAAESGYFKLLFVVAEEAGKVRERDQTLINLVMGSIVLENAKMARNSYGVIINKCTSLTSKAFNDKDQFNLKTTFDSDSQTNKFPTGLVKFVPNLDGKDEGKYDFEALKKWIIKDVPYLNGSSSVAEIDGRNLQEHVAAVRLQHENEKAETKLNEVNQDLSKELDASFDGEIEKPFYEAIEAMQLQLDLQLERQLERVRDYQKKEEEKIERLFQEQKETLERSMKSEHDKALIEIQTKKKFDTIEVRKYMKEKIEDANKRKRQHDKELKSRLKSVQEGLQEMKTKHDRQLKEDEEEHKKNVEKKKGSLLEMRSNIVVLERDHEKSQKKLVNQIESQNDRILFDARTVDDSELEGFRVKKAQEVKKLYDAAKQLEKESKRELEEMERSRKSQRERLADDLKKEGCNKILQNKKENEKVMYSLKQVLKEKENAISREESRFEHSLKAKKRLMETEEEHKKQDIKLKQDRERELNKIAQDEVETETKLARLKEKRDLKQVESRFEEELLALKTRLESQMNSKLRLLRGEKSLSLNDVRVKHEKNKRKLENIAQRKAKRRKL